MGASLLKAEFALHGIKQKDFRNVLANEYGISAAQTDISRAISGTGNNPLHDRIRTKAWDYVGKLKSNQERIGQQ